MSITLASVEPGSHLCATTTSGNAFPSWGTDRRQTATMHIQALTTNSNDTPQMTAPLLEKMQWEHSIEERVEQSNQLLHEMHTMLTDQHTNNVNPDMVATQVNSGALSRVTASAQPTTEAQLMLPTYLPRVTASGQVGGINVWHEPTGEEMAGNQVPSCAHNWLCCMLGEMTSILRPVHHLSKSVRSSWNLLSW